LYVQGLAYNLAKDTEKAKDAIKKALAEAPTFSLATEALSSLEKQAEGAPKE
jgi:Tfp pilus assembly protein PilF